MKDKIDIGILATVLKMASVDEPTQGGETYDANGVEHYRNIHNNYRPVAIKLLKAKQYLGANGKLLKFLDVGSGTGNIMSLATGLGFNASGVEYREDFAEQSTAQVRKKTDYMNALDFEDYGKFDLIYFYQPIKAEIEMVKLINTINDQAQESALFIPYIVSKSIKAYIAEIWERIAPGVYTKK